MSKIVKGIIAGLAFGGIDVLLMLPMSFPDKKTALIGAFCSRFAIGFAIACADLPWPGWLVGIVLGLLISLPDAVITKAYIPILIVGALGGAIIGGLLHGWSART